MTQISAVTLATMLALHPVTVDYAGRLGSYARLIDTHAERCGLSRIDVIAIILKESSGNAKAVNFRSGATGLMQVMPCDTPNEAVRHYFTARPTSKQLRDPDLNLQWGCDIFRQKLARADGDLKMALYYYSGGDHWSSFEAYEKEYWAYIERYRDALAELEQVCWRVQICQ